MDSISPISSSSLSSTWWQFDVSSGVWMLFHSRSAFGAFEKTAPTLEELEGLFQYNLQEKDNQG